MYGVCESMDVCRDGDFAREADPRTIELIRTRARTNETLSI